MKKIFGTKLIFLVFSDLLAQRRAFRDKLKMHSGYKNSTGFKSFYLCSILVSSIINEERNGFDVPSNPRTKTIRFFWFRPPPLTPLSKPWRNHYKNRHKNQRENQQKNQRIIPQDSLRIDKPLYRRKAIRSESYGIDNYARKKILH